MTLSIVVPVYNVEPYLTKCIDSLLQQDIPPTEYEIILVDDGSTDDSGDLCDEYAVNYGNIRVIHQPNGGLSAARNAGVAAAEGKYIQFVDSDDYLNANILAGIIGQMERQSLDILRINYQNVNEKGQVFEPNKYSKPFVDYSEEVCDGLTFLNERLGFACYAIQFVVKASLLHQEGNAFKEGIFYEDMEWAPRILLQAKRIASSPTMVYNYLYRQNSITRNISLDKKRKSIEDKIYLIEHFAALRQELSDDRWFDGMISQTVLSLFSIISRYFYSERKSYLRRLRDLHIYPLSTYHATKSAKRKILLANLSPSILCAILHLH